MKVKIIDLLNAGETLRNVMGMEFTPAVSIKIVKIVKKIDEELENFEQVKEKISAKYKLTGAKELTDKQKAQFQKELTELLEAEVNIDVEPLPIAFLDGHKITPSSLMNIEWLIV